MHPMRAFTSGYYEYGGGGPKHLLKDLTFNLETGPKLEDRSPKLDGAIS